MVDLVFRKLKGNWYSIVALISAVRSRGLDVRSHTASSLEEVLAFDESTIVAYSLTTFDYEVAEEEIPVLKEKGFTVIAGGPHPTVDPGSLLRLGVDYVFAGDGEENIVRFLLGERPEGRIFDGLKNRIDLDHYPPFDPELDLFMPIEISRGCPFRCGYCFTPTIAGGRMRYRSVDLIVHYAKLGVEKNRKVARFIASNAFGYMSRNGVTPNLDAIDDLLYKLKKVGMEEIYFGTFPSDVRPESVNDDVMELIKKYVNNRSIVIGAQSGSDRILKMINRGHTVETVERAVEIVSAHGFTPHVDFIFGFPFEEDEDVVKTFDFMERLVKKYNAKIHAHTFLPLPGTPLSRYGAGKLKRVHYKVLGYLSAKGIVDGYWHKQAELSRRIERFAVGGGAVITDTG